MKLLTGMEPTPDCSGLTTLSGFVDRWIRPCLGIVALETLAALRFAEPTLSFCQSNNKTNSTVPESPLSIQYNTIQIRLLFPYKAFTMSHYNEYVTTQKLNYGLI